MSDRDHQLHVMISEEERRMLWELAAKKGVTPSTQARLLIREAHERKTTGARPR